MVKDRPEKADNLLEKIRWCIERRKFRLTPHCVTRQKQRSIGLPDITFVLLNGFHEEEKTKFNEEFNTWKYAIRGKTLDKIDIRVIVAFEKDMVIITAIRMKRRKK